MTFVIYIILFFLILLAAICILLTNKVISINTFDTQRIIRQETENGVLDIEAFEKLKKEEVSIPSNFGYEITGWLIRPEEPSDKVMIFSHGITMSRYGSIKYMGIFRKRGWNCILYDHRRHGSTKGKHTTFGFYEKSDLKSVVDWTRAKFGTKATIGIHGESMGSAITLLYAAMEDGADFYIVDCPYSSLDEQLSYRLKVEYHLPRWPIIPLVNKLIKLRAGFELDWVSPKENIHNIQSPILFIHGLNDRYIPVDMTRELYERKQGMKRLYLAEKGGHAASYQNNREEYEKAVEAFLSEINR